MMERLNEPTGWTGEPLPDPPPQDAIRDSFRQWMTRGYFEWETEGWPFWSNLHHTQTYWPHRELDNILLVHYSDLLQDLNGQISLINEARGAAGGGGPAARTGDTT